MITLTPQLIDFAYQVQQDHERKQQKQEKRRRYLEKQIAIDLAIKAARRQIVTNLTS